MHSTAATQPKEFGTALTIAGFDPSSGAGCSADLMVLATHGIFATAAVTALTVQSTAGVRAVEATRPELLQQILDCLEDDLPPAAIKIGMLATAAQVRVVAAYLRQVKLLRSVQVVVDPVMQSSSGATLLDHSGIEALQDELLPLVDAVTPNLGEAAALSGKPCTSRAQMQVCATALHTRYPHLRVIITGGHLDVPADLLLDAQEFHWLKAKRIETRATHGTGCAFSTALLAHRMQGKSWTEATASAKAYVADAMRRAVPRGKGNGPMDLIVGLSGR